MIEVTVRVKAEDPEALERALNEATMHAVNGSSGGSYRGTGYSASLTVREGGE